MNYLDCHEEPIHIPGHIQSYGYLLGLDAGKKTIKFYSQNILDLFPFDDEEELFGQKIDHFADVFGAILDAPVYYQFQNSGDKLSSEFGKIQIKGEEYYISVFRHGGYIYLEFEKIIIKKKNQEIIYKSIRNINSVENAEEIWDELTEQISRITDYDRVMVYQFLSDGSGRVIAERKLDGLPSFLNIYYPESDVPRQARAMYLKNHKRIFSNVFSAPVPVISKKEKEIDLTYSNVRAMSPIHAQYLKNAGVASSFSTSIIVDNELWGLVTCHSKKPKHIDLYSRIQAEIFTTMSANLFMSYQSKKTVKFLEDFEKAAKSLKSKFQKADNVKDSLFQNVSEMQKLLQCDGLAVVSENEIKTSGSVPQADTILRIRDWYLAGSEENIFVSHEFLKNFGEELGLDSTAAGILMIPFPEFENISLMCFRKEFQEHIKWAGLQEKNVETVQFYDDEKLMVSPRKSLEIFSEEVKGKSNIWSKNNLHAAQIIRELILEISAIQFSKIQDLNKELSELNEELESFTYTVSHDLASPLTVMKLNAQLLERSSENEKNVDKAQKIVKEIDTISKFLTDILHFSRAKYSNIELSEIDVLPIIKKAVADSKLNFQSSNTQVTIGETPNIFADETLAMQVFQNIISNAVKYSSVKDHPEIHISGTEKEDTVEYTVSDNGIGISKDDVEDIFRIFFRSRNSKSMKGNGVGLHIVHRIMERIGGNIRFESEEGKGSHFILTFKKP